MATADPIECPMDVEQTTLPAPPIITLPTKPVAQFTKKETMKGSSSSTKSAKSPKKMAKKTSRLPPSEKKVKTKKTKRKITKTKKITKTTKTVKTTIIRRRVLTRENKFKMRRKQFRAWVDDQFVIDVLKKRGWTYLGEPIKEGREDYPNTMYEALEEGRISHDECLYWADDDDSKVLKGFSSNHLISSIPNADKALSKVYQQKMFGEYSWFPKCFTLPKERELLKKYLEENPESYWIAKPRDSYGGFGMCVFKANSEDFQGVLDRKTTFALQRYMENPYLFGGAYKFHFRCYMMITNVVDPYRAYLWKNAQIQFSTHPFDLTQIEKKFNKYCHITNYKVNNEKKNTKFVVQDKPGIGCGTEWALQTFFDAMRDEPKFSEEKFWRELTAIAKVVGQKLSTCSHVKRGLRTPYSSVNHFEIYGLDVIMDEHCNLALTEANTQPGLDDTKPTMPNGVFNPEIVKANDITEGIINDSLTLLQVDSKRKFFSPWIRLHEKEEF